MHGESTLVGRICRPPGLRIHAILAATCGHCISWNTLNSVTSLVCRVATSKPLAWQLTGLPLAGWYPFTKCGAPLDEAACWVQAESSTNAYVLCFGTSSMCSIGWQCCCLLLVQCARDAAV